MAKAPTRSRTRRSKRRQPKPGKEATVVGSELISSALPGFGGVKGFEMMSPDDLLTRRGYKIYREMSGDDQIKACLWYKKVLLCARPYDIKPVSDSTQDKEVAEFIQDNLKDIGFDTILWEALSAFEFGFSTGEIIWHIDDDKKGAPKLKVKTIKFRDPEYMHIITNEQGDIEKFVQKPASGPGSRNINISPEKIFHYAYQRQFSNHMGVSDLRAAYRAWWSKKYVTQFWNVFLERFGAPLMMMKYPQGASEQLKSTLKSIMSNLSSKTDVLIPEGVVIELVEATRAGTAKYDEALTHYDVRIATAILIPALLGMGGSDIKKGADSQSRLQLRTLMKVIQHVGNELAQITKEKIIKPLVDANFNVKEYPDFIFQDYGEFEAFEITDAIKEMWNAGILDLDQEDINFARSILGMSIRAEDQEDETNRPDPSMASQPFGMNQPGGGGADQGNDRAKKAISNKKTDQTGRQRPSRR